MSRDLAMQSPTHSEAIPTTIGAAVLQCPELGPTPAASKDFRVAAKGAGVDRCQWSPEYLDELSRRVALAAVLIVGHQSAFRRLVWLFAIFAMPPPFFERLPASVVAFKPRSSLPAARATRRITDDAFVIVVSGYLAAVGMVDH